MKFNEKILKSSKVHGSRVVLALDFSDPYERRLDHAIKVLEETKESLAAVKVNHHLLLPYGLGGIKAVIEVSRSAGLPLIADLKLNDIESTNLNVADSLLSYGFDAVIANPFAGKEEGLGMVVTRMHDAGGGVILLVYMSHKGSSEGYGLKLEDGEPVYRVFAGRARDWGADGVVVSAKAVDLISETRRIVGKDCLIFSPGIGAQGGDVGSGAGRGADFMIVGRGITESPEPAKAVKGLNSA